MKHLRKFEDLDFSTYKNAADIIGKNQPERADKIMKHAISMSREIVDGLKFGILVGDIRPFPDARLESMNVFKSSDQDGWILQAIFKSGNNTHRISSSFSSKGVLSWRDGNKFLDRRSVMDFEKAVKSLVPSQKDLMEFLSQNGLKSENITVDKRTYYK